MRALLIAAFLTTCAAEPITEDCDMALPLSRDVTCTAATKVSSALINKLQDCIIGAKQGSLPMWIPGSAFVVYAGVPTRSGNTWSLATSGDVVFAPLILPVGTRITELTWSGVYGSLTTGLSCTPIGGGAIVPVVGFSASGAGTTWTQKTLATAGITAPYGALPHVIQDGYLYYLIVGGYSTPASKIDGVKVTFDRL